MKTATQKYGEPWDGILAIGRVLGAHAIATRKITLVYKGNCDQTSWRRAPHRLARKLGGPYGASVYYSPKHPDVIVVVSSGSWDKHYTQHDIHQLIGAGTTIRHVLGENHPDIPFYVGCEDIVRAHENWVTGFY